MNKESSMITNEELKTILDTWKTVSKDKAEGFQSKIAEKLGDKKQEFNDYMNKVKSGEAVSLVNGEGRERILAKRDEAYASSYLEEALMTAVSEIEKKEIAKGLKDMLETIKFGIDDAKNKNAKGINDSIKELISQGKDIANNLTDKKEKVQKKVSDMNAEVPTALVSFAKDDKNQDIKDLIGSIKDGIKDIKTNDNLKDILNVGNDFIKDLKTNKKDDKPKKKKNPKRKPDGSIDEAAVEVVGEEEYFEDEPTTEEPIAEPIAEEPTTEEVSGEALVSFAKDDKKQDIQDLIGSIKDGIKDIKTNDNLKDILNIGNDLLKDLKIN
jgi:hypothetical protein